MIRSCFERLLNLSWRWRWLQRPLMFARERFRHARAWRDWYRRFRESVADDRKVLGFVPAERALLKASRIQFGHRYGRPMQPPRISIVVATYNRCDMLLDRALPSLLAQDYPDVEVIVVGDGCTDATEARIRALGDPRVRFENLTERQKYPPTRVEAHMVSGVMALNRAISLATGDWIAQCDDDEQFTADHLRTLWEAAEWHGWEYVWARTIQEVSPGQWVTMGSAAWRLFEVPHSTLLYRAYLRDIPYDAESWKVGLYHDRHRLRRMRLAGARGGFVPNAVTLAPLRAGNTKPWVEAEDRAVSETVGALP